MFVCWHYNCLIKIHLNIILGFLFQDGIIVETVDDWPQMEGQRFRDISRQVFQGDYDIISTLATFEHLSMISQMPASPSISVQVGGCVEWQLGVWVVVKKVPNFVTSSIQESWTKFHKIWIKTCSEFGYLDKRVNMVSLIYSSEYSCFFKSKSQLVSILYNILKSLNLLSNIIYHVVIVYLVHFISFLVQV